MPFLRNSWYMAGWSHEVPADKLLGRRIAADTMLLFRDTAGVVTRRATAASIASRRCTSAATSATGSDAPITGCNSTARAGESTIRTVAVAPYAKVASYPLIERWGCLWAWMGDATTADPANIPDFSCLDAERNHVGHGYMLADAGYTLETDNIMDLGHIEFLYPGTLGGGGVSGGETKVDQDGMTVCSKRLIRNQIVPDFVYRTFGIDAGGGSGVDGGCGFVVAEAADPGGRRGAVRARRTLDKLIRDEQDAKAAA